MADILRTNIARSSPDVADRQELMTEMNQYELYKKSYANDIVFDPTQTKLCKLNDNFLFYSVLLAPTGALVLMMVYYISEAANPLFQIWSIYAFLYCYKCHSKSLKQYQCN